jgi:hypothetical protein
MDVDRSKIGAPPGFGEATPLADSIDDPVQHKASAAGTGTAVDFESDSMIELKQALREGRVLLKVGGNGGVGGVGRGQLGVRGVRGEGTGVR